MKKELLFRKIQIVVKGIKRMCFCETSIIFVEQINMRIWDRKHHWYWWRTKNCLEEETNLANLSKLQNDKNNSHDILQTRNIERANIPLSKVAFEDIWFLCNNNKKKTEWEKFVKMCLRLWLLEFDSSE